MSNSKGLSLKILKTVLSKSNQEAGTREVLLGTPWQFFQSSYVYKHYLTGIVQPFYQYRTDILIVSVLAIAIAVASFLASQQIPDPVLTDFYAQDTWFGGDLPTVFGNITSLKSDFGRNNKHPLFPLLVFPLVFGVGKLLHLEPITTTRLVLALTAALWIIALYGLFRLMGCQRLDTAIFCLLGSVSAAAMFWFVVPDSFPFASLTILLGLGFVALTQHRKLAPAWYVAISALTVSITITNWMVGLLATIVNFRWKKALKITFLAFCVVNGLWLVQRVIFPNTGLPFQPKTFIGEKKFMSGPDAESIVSALSSFVYQTMVMPAVHLSDSLLRPGWPKPEVNTLAPGSGGIWGILAVVAWTGLLLLGLWGYFSTKRHLKLRLVLGLTILGQLLIHSVYGTGETFIYSLHFAPLLLAVAAFASLTRMRLLGLALACLLLISAGINNRSQFNQLTTGLLDYGTPRQRVQAQMRVRPADYWSRGSGHVVLAVPGSREADKAYHEPGGSFSPGAGSFGVSIWMVDKAGNPKITSDQIPLEQVQQQFTYTAGKNTPGIFTKTAFYQSSWSAVKPGIWQLSLKAATNPDIRSVLIIRSVGPAAGTIKMLNWDGQRLLINDRWTIKNLPTLAKVSLGSERSPGWVKQASTASQWQDEKGWGYARLDLGEGDTWEITFEDTAPIAQPDLKVAGASSSLVLNLPDAQFVDSLNAQVAHLLMGLTGNQTRPVDPIEYPLPRLREGAYEMVALARTGHLEVAKQLSTYFAETDFINGFHPEADIPAVGIWALAAVAEQLNQPGYDQWLWPHIHRKAELIVDMLSTNRPGYPVAETTQAPFTENPDFVRLDLVSGKMEGSSGLISLDQTTNIMSYRALLDAASLADRIKQSTNAQRWRSQAEQLKVAWKQNFDPKFSQLNTTYTNGLWPSGIVEADQNAFIQGLRKRWDADHDVNGTLKHPPDNTYLNLAETHQWLLLGEVDRVWKTLQWFWAHQSSPGLYTWWGKTNELDGTPVPTSLSHWPRLQGWVNPPHITPHYRTAAEMALLQLDMLAYIDRAATAPTLVIGAGIPKEWLNQPLSIKGLLVGGHLVNWAWDGQQMSVQVQGQKLNVELGSAFSINTPISVTVL